MTFKITPFLVSLKLAISFIVLILLSACSGSDSNPKDYWDLEEPTIHTWDTDISAKTLVNTKPISEFKSSEIHSSLGYKSFLKFQDMPPEIKFEIFTECLEVFGEDQIQTSKPRIFSKTSFHDRSDVLFFYDFLPDPVLSDDVFTEISSSYSCDYRITAINSINSKIHYNIKDLKINTNRKNEINLFSKLDEKSPLKSIDVNPDRAITDLPSLYLDEDSSVTYEMGLNLTHHLMTGPGSIKCIGHEKIELNPINKLIVLNDIVNPLKSKALDTDSTFFKKCRVLSMIDSADNINDGQDESFSKKVRRQVWSEYFNVIFEQPKIAIDIKDNPELRNEAYPFNRELHLENEVMAFKITFTNNSKSALVMRLPSSQRIEAVLNPIAFLIQLPGFKPAAHKNWPGLRSHQLKEEFMSEIKFTLDGEVVSEFTLFANSSKTLELILVKNFKCEIANIESSNSPYKNAERGFRIQAIPLNSEEDKITIDYMNRGDFETFPETFSFDRLLQKASSNLETTRIVNLDGRREKTNFLQMTNSRTHAIDTLVFRSVLDIQLPPPPKNLNVLLSNNYQSMGESIQYQIHHEAIESARRSNTYPSQLRLSNEDTHYCEAL